VRPFPREIEYRDRKHQQLICKRERGICILHNTVQRAWECQGHVGLSAHHILKKLTIETRYNPKMSAALCLACHRWAEDNPWLAIPLIVEMMVFNMILKDRQEFEDLVKLSGQNISLKKG